MKVKLNRASLLSVVAVCTSLCAASAASAQETLRLLTGFPISNTINANLTDVFVDAVREASNGELEVSVLGPESVGTFEQFEPVSLGVFDILVTHPGYHAGITPLGISLDAILPKPELRRSSGVFDSFADHYRDLSMELIAMPAVGHTGFQVILRDGFAESSEAPLDGMRVRGIQTYFPLLSDLGASPVVMPAQEIYTALDRGVVDGAVWGTVGLTDLRWNEVASKLVRPTFGQASLMIFVGAPTWARLSDEQRAALQSAGASVELVTPDRFQALYEAETAALTESGMEIIEMPEAIASNLEVNFANGVWDFVEERAGAEASQIRAQVVETGLYPE